MSILTTEYVQFPTGRFRLSVDGCFGAVMLIIERYCEPCNCWFPDRYYRSFPLIRSALPPAHVTLIDYNAKVISHYWGGRLHRVIDRDPPTQLMLPFVQETPL